MTDISFEIEEYYSQNLVADILANQVRIAKILASGKLSLRPEKIHIWEFEDNDQSLVSVNGISSNLRITFELKHKPKGKDCYKHKEITGDFLKEIQDAFSEFGEFKVNNMTYDTLEVAFAKSGDMQ